MWVVQVFDIIQSLKNYQTKYVSNLSNFGNLNDLNNSIKYIYNIPSFLKLAG